MTFLQLARARCERRKPRHAALLCSTAPGGEPAQEQERGASTEIPPAAAEYKMAIRGLQLLLSN